jgi:hypothetical protein
MSPQAAPSAPAPERRIVALDPPPSSSNAVQESEEVSQSFLAILLRCLSAMHS